MGIKHSYSTAALRFLKQQEIPFSIVEIDYVEHGGTHYSATVLGVDEHYIIKTIVLHDENKKGLIVLMHGDYEISTRNLARQIQCKHIKPATFQMANKWTGYLFGGTSPFGTRTTLPIYIESSILELDFIYINGGRRGLLLRMNPEYLQCLHPHFIEVKIKK